MSKRSIRLILYVILGFQAVMLIYLNLTQLSVHLGHDTTVYLFQTITSWQQKKLLLDNWMYQTTFGIDSPVPLATLIYGIVKDVFIAYGLANVILTGIFAFLLWKLMVRFELSVETKLVLMNLSLGLHFGGYYMVFNSLDYGSVMFVDNGAYIVKTIIALLVMISSIDLLNGRSDKIVLGITAALVLVSGISSGFWILVTSVVPIIIWRIGYDAMSKSFKAFKEDKTLIFNIVLALLSALGQFLMVVCFDHPTIDSAMKMVKLQDFWSNLGSVLMGYMEVSGALCPADRQLLSFDGIAMLILFIVAVLALFSFIFVMRDKESLKNKSVQVMMATVIENFFLFTVCSAKWGSLIYEVRYLILLYLMSLIALGIFFERKMYKIYNEEVLALLASAGIIISSVNSFVVYMRTSDDVRVDRCHDLIDVIGSTDAKIVYNFGKVMLVDCREMRVLDTDHVYKLVVDAGMGHMVYHFGDTTYLDDPAEYSGPVIFIYHDSETEDIPEHIFDDSTEIYNTEDGYHVLYLDHNIDDFYSEYIM